MSWLSNIVNKTEDFLNQVDQSASVVLQKDDKVGPGSTSSRSDADFAMRSSTTTQSHHKTYSYDGSQQFLGYAAEAPPQATNSVTLATTSRLRGSQKRDMRSSGYASSVSSLVSKENAQDDKLLAYLNNPSTADNQTTVPQSRSRKSSGSSIRSMPTHAIQALFNTSVVNVSTSQDESSPSKAQYHVPGLGEEVDHSTRDQRHYELQRSLDNKEAEVKVLAIKLQEAQSQLELRSRAIRKLESERERLLKDTAHSTQHRDQALDSVQVELGEAKALIEQEKHSAQRTEKEYLNRINKLENEKSNLRHEIMGVQKTITDEKLKARDTVDQLKLAKYNLEANKQEFDEYKQKAQRILQSKEKLIETLKCGINTENDKSEMQILLTELTHERDLLKEEMQQSHLTHYNLKGEIQELESQLAAEQRASLEMQRNLQEKAQNFQQNSTEFREQSEQLKQECQYLQGEIHNQKMQLHAKLQEKDAEIQRMTSQFAAKSLSVTSESEIEGRVRTLTENLIQKQSLIETLQTEKNSLSLQLERVDRLYHEAENAAMRASGSVAIRMGQDDNGSLVNRIPAFLRESPFDTGVTRGVKKAYSTMDTLSVKVGVFIRRYPIARVPIFVYVFLLHLWVMVVLLTYTPEVHGKDFNSKLPTD